MSDFSDGGRRAPADWLFVRAARGLGVWLVEAKGPVARAYAPPGTALRRSDKRLHLQQWRTAVWDADVHGRFDLLTTEPSDGTFETLSTRAVVDAVPDSYRDWVVKIMRAQIRQAESFAQPPNGQLLDEGRSRAAAERLVALRGELSDAFPGEEWYRPAPLELPEVPDNPSELLGELWSACHREPAPPIRRRGAGWLLHVVGRVATLLYERRFGDLARSVKAAGRSATAPVPGDGGQAAAREHAILSR